LKKKREIQLNFRILGYTYWAAIYLLSGCALSPSHTGKYPSEEIFDSQSRLDYIKYIQENQKNINIIYSQSYDNYEYLVDSDSGVTLIQHLINPELVYPITNKVVSEDQSQTEKAINCFNYIIQHFRYFPMPETWPTIAQTLKIRKGDCKGLSLLLLSILISFDIECYAAIGNSHMWVEAKLSGGWKIFETDSDPNRNLIYQLPGFYEKPLFKIFYNRSEKRIRMKEVSIE